MLKIFFVYTFLLLSVVVLLTSCKNQSDEPETLFEYTQRYSGIYDNDTSDQYIEITNPIGFIFLSGIDDSTKIGYVLDKTVRVTESSLAQDAFDQIVLNYSSQTDTSFCTVSSPSEISDNYKCSLNLDIPYQKKVVVKNPNNGVYTSHLVSDLYVETDYENCTVDQHFGSLETRTKNGNINADILMLTDGYCTCVSEQGNITVRIPSNTPATIQIKTISGSITYTNLTLDITTKTKTELSGSIGDGTNQIYLESKYGNITLEGI